MCVSLICCLWSPCDGSLISQPDRRANLRRLPRNLRQERGRGGPEGEVRESGGRRSGERRGWGRGEL